MLSSLTFKIKEFFISSLNPLGIIKIFSSSPFDISKNSFCPSKYLISALDFSVLSLSKISIFKGFKSKGLFSFSWLNIPINKPINIGIITNILKFGSNVEYKFLNVVFIYINRPIKLFS